jgi:hypothetical protein
MRSDSERREPGEPALGERLARLEAEVGALERLLRGNGDGGLRTRIELLAARVEGLQSQWKWIVGVLTAVAVAVAQASLRR